MLRVERARDSGAYTPPFPLSYFTEEDREHFCCQQTGLTFRYPVESLLEHVKDHWTDPARLQEPLFRILCYWQRMGIEPHSVLAQPVTPHSFAWQHALQQELRDADEFFAEQERLAYQEQLEREFEQAHEERPLLMFTFVPSSYPIDHTCNEKNRATHARAHYRHESSRHTDTPHVPRCRCTCAPRARFSIAPRAALLFQRRACSFSCENIIFNIEGYTFMCV